MAFAVGCAAIKAGGCTYCLVSQLPNHNRTHLCEYMHCVSHVHELSNKLGVPRAGAASIFKGKVCPRPTASSNPALKNSV
ncbi:hypothetical protein DSLASN_16910 [Desulfoluna limicola]|uniref:Uncharacterized protein n=1 Tax=Desulfoluna limicola TaxID=2810562 RepID=A0ABN6F227_9BACT|nr:hypothetical protein DSLASN_16910 [Desulfoluna limicola]